MSEGTQYCGAEGTPYKVMKLKNMIVAKGIGSLAGNMLSQENFGF